MTAEVELRSPTGRYVTVDKVTLENGRRGRRLKDGRVKFDGYPTPIMLPRNWIIEVVAIAKP